MSICHQCLIYEGLQYTYLEAVAERIRRHLRGNYRCVYMHNEPTIAALRSYLSAVGVDVDQECRRTSLVLSSEPMHRIRNRAFDPDRMMGLVEQLLGEALRDNFSGLFGSGDMTWEFGPKKDFSKLLEYEWRLEHFIREHPQLIALCHYHADTLPREALRMGAIAHEMMFVDGSLSVPNPNYIQAKGRGSSDRGMPVLSL